MMMMKKVYICVVIWVFCCCYSLYSYASSNCLLLLIFRVCSLKSLEFPKFSCQPCCFLDSVLASFVNLVDVIFVSYFLSSFSFFSLAFPLKRMRSSLRSYRLYLSLQMKWFEYTKKQNTIRLVSMLPNSVHTQRERISPFCYFSLSVSVPLLLNLDRAFRPLWVSYMWFTHNASGHLNLETGWVISEPDGVWIRMYDVITVFHDSAIWYVLFSASFVFWFALKRSTTLLNSFNFIFFETLYRNWELDCPDHTRSLCHDRN